MLIGYLGFAKRMASAMQQIKRLTISVGLLWPLVFVSHSVWAAGTAAGVTIFSVAFVSYNFGRMHRRSRSIPRARTTY
jgi:hypothetical protein